MFRLAREENGERDQADDPRRGAVGQRPAAAARHVQGAGAGQEGAGIPAVDRHRGARAVLLDVENFHPVGVDRDVLGRGEDRQGQRERRQRRRRARRILQAHQQHGGHEQDLAGEDPRPPLAERAVQARQPTRGAQRKLIA